MREQEGELGWIFFFLSWVGFYSLEMIKLNEYNKVSIIF